MPKFARLYYWLLPLIALLACGDQQSGEKAALAAETTAATSSEKTSVSNQINITAQLPVWPLKEKKEKGKLYPFDQGPEQPDFKAFRDTFYQAVKDKNLDYLLSVIDKRIKMSFGDINGKEAFIASWQLDTAAQASQLWKELSTALELGGGFSEHEKSVFMAPWLFVTTRIDDPYADGAIVGKGVRIRETANSNGKVLGSLSYDKVTVNYEGTPKTEMIGEESHQWFKINTSSGLSGYVYGKYVRLPVDYRVIFEKIEGHWKMISFIAGD